MTVATDPARRVTTETPRERPDRSPRRLTVGVLAVWAAVLVGARWWGLIVASNARGDLYLGAIPLFGAWRFLVTGRLVVAVVIGVAGVVVLPAIAARWRWPVVLAATAIGAVAWSGALAYADAPAAWTSIHDDYGQHMDRVAQSGVGGFLRDYTADQPTFPTHLQAHPPGMVVLLWASAQLGLSGHAYEVSLALAGAAAAAVAALVVLADVAGKQHARRAAPFVVLLPAAVWHTNADTFYAGVVGAAVALTIVASTRTGSRQTVFAITGGAVFAVALLLTYGVALLAVPIAMILYRRRALRVGLIATAAAVAVLAIPAFWGFWWPAGLAATKRQYDINLALVRPAGYFRFANLAVFALALGPAIAVALARLREHAVWVVVGCGLAVIALADASGLSSGETERIWQPFIPLVAVAGCALAGPLRRSAARPWLGLQVITTIGLQVALRSPW